MKALKDLKYKLMNELEEMSRKGNMKGSDLEMVHMLTDTIKNIDKICMLEDQGYSNAGGNSGGGYSSNGWVADGRVEYGRDGGGSYNGYSERRDSMGRYTRGEGGMREYMEKLMHMTHDPEEKEMLRRMMSRMG